MHVFDREALAVENCQNKPTQNYSFRNVRKLTVYL